MDGKFEISSLFNFDKLVAPTVLKIVYWIGLVGIAVWFLVAVVAAIGLMGYSVGSGLGGILLAFAGLIFGTLLWRVMIEIYTVIFGIHERLGEIRDRLPPAK